MGLVVVYMLQVLIWMGLMVLAPAAVVGAVGGVRLWWVMGQGGRGEPGVSGTRRLGAAETAVLMLVGLGVFMWGFAPISWRVVYFVFGGGMLSARPIVTGGALDQPSLHKGFFLCCLFMVVTGLYLLVVSYLADRERREVRLVYRALAVLCLLPTLCALTATFYDLLRYIGAMGHTPSRDQGVVFALGVYVVVFVFVALSGCRGWPWWPRPRREGLCPACGYDLRGTPGNCPECGWRKPETTEPGGKKRKC